MGVLAPVSALAGHSAQPPIALAEIFRHACLQSCLQTSPTTSQKSYLKFQKSTTIFAFCPTHYVIVQGGWRGVTNIFLYWNLNN